MLGRAQTRFGSTGAGGCCSEHFTQYLVFGNSSRRSFGISAPQSMHFIACSRLTSQPGPVTCTTPSRLGEHSYFIRFLLRTLWARGMRRQSEELVHLFQHGESRFRSVGITAAACAVLKHVYLDAPGERGSFVRADRLLRQRLFPGAEFGGPINSSRRESGR